MGDVAVVFTREEIRIRGVDHPAPAGVGGDILESGGHPEGPVGAGPGAGDLDLQAALLSLQQLYASGIFSFRGQAIPVEFAKGHLGFPGGPDEKDVVGLEGQKERGAGLILAERHHPSPAGSGGGGDDEQRLGGLGEFAEAQRDRFFVRSCHEFQRQGGPSERD